ncbi:type VI secretion protein [Streptomyces sp. URMC 129]|uniref:type VI secretion protein n=1 Tax=Streptomyces sp. URMC 129 TaxID=3423407 RepID=UPI003F198CD4
MSHDQRAPRHPASTPVRRGGGGVPDALLVGTLAALVGLTAFTWSATCLAGWLRHGAWPEGVSFPATASAMRSLLTAPGDIPGAWPDAAPETLPTASLMWLVFLGQVAVLFATVLWVMIRLARWRARREAPREEHEPGPAPAPAPAPEEAAPAAPVGPVAPAVAAPLPPPVTPAPREATAPPAPAVAFEERDTESAVVDAPAGLVVIDPDGRLWTTTGRRRRVHGPVHVYDPGHVTDAAVRLRWAPQRGCEDMLLARRRAAALLGPFRPTEPVFQLDADAAETLLRCYLHAASLAGAPFTQVHRWANGRSTSEPAKILRTHSRAAGGASMELESTLTSHPGRRDAALRLIGRALAGLEQLHIRQACTPGRVDALALDNLTGESATLYIVGDRKETAGLRTALLDALATDQPTLTVLDRT